MDTIESDKIENSFYVKYGNKNDGIAIVFGSDVNDQIHNIDEDIPIGTSILKVIAKVSDSSKNAIIEYFITDDNFRINNNGIVHNNKKLDADREELKMMPVTVRAVDSGKFPLEGFINRDIEINSTIDRVTASDADADENI
ncbi:hypothetical protein HCN44_011025 [Aphidius gifuensis]|uniref:Cadherin domain-containing protein n=1 Tax=Aphidius gifuensis TaxID=684658 RepID=A0A834Y8G7_APHGI|nr:hypothetical protein HCN44_011025 [Aphidius gifuensis]